MRPERGNKPVPLNQVLNSLLSSYGLEKTVEQYQVFNDWEEVVKKKIAMAAKPDSIKFGVLYIKVKDAAWRHNLFCMKHEILEKIKKHSKTNTITDLKLI